MMRELPLAKATLSRTCVTVQRIHLYFLIDRELLIGGSASSFRKTYSSAVRRVNLRNGKGVKSTGHGRHLKLSYLCLGDWWGVASFFMVRDVGKPQWEQRKCPFSLCTD